MNAKPITRMILAFLALAGIFVASYLTMYKMGVFGELVCSIDGCETVNLSKWSEFLGFPVAAWGVMFYLGMLVLTLVSLSDRFVSSKAFSVVFVVQSAIGVLFSGWLTYLELFVIHAICIWCVISALIVTLMLIVSALDLHALNRSVTHSGIVEP